MHRIMCTGKAVHRHLYTVPVYIVPVHSLAVDIILCTASLYTTLLCTATVHIRVVDSRQCTVHY